MGKCLGLMYSILNDQVYTFLCDRYFNMKKNFFYLLNIYVLYIICTGK